MGIKTYNPYTPSRRNMTGSDFSEITKTTPEKSLVTSLKKNAGRNNQGKITVRHQGGGNRRKYSSHHGYTQRTFYCRRQFQIDRPGGKSRGTKRKNRLVSLRTLL